jgi:alpha-galactosidase
MVAVAQDVLDLAPGALFFNYGNPMTAVCRAIRKETGAGVIGLCHGVFHVGKQIADWLGVAPAAFRYTAVGLNHLTWFVEMRADGEDLMPRMQARAVQVLGEGFSADRLATGSAEAGTAAPEDSVLDRTQPFCLHLLRVFGAYPAVGDRHVSEFFPQLFPRGKHFGKTLGVDRFSLEQVIANGDRIYADMKEKAFSKEPLGERFFEQMSGEHEQVIEIVESIRRDLGRVYSANLPNQGQVPNLPPEAVLESPAVATGSGMRAIAQPPLASGIAGTLATRLAWVETVVEAALEGSRQKFIQALILDGAVTSIDTAEELADDLLAAHAEYLPLFKQDSNR